MRVGSSSSPAIDGPTCAACCRRRRPAGASMSTVPDAAGQILIPEQFSGSQALRATLERLVLEKRRVEAAPVDDRTRAIRAIFRISRCTSAICARHAHARRVRPARRSACRRASVSTTSRSTAHRRTRKGRANGSSTPEGPRSSLKATVTSDDVAATLRALNYTDVIEAKHGEMHGESRVAGGFDSDMLDRAAGTISVRC